ncbi:RNI-like protein [Basidiobolus meristosporus CBS 931.73]|uniref:RNI-like protein n=1 Tax=Basidiobolus meristosporus CBS 931.73 TaxID=1314790 RepID=A0A1Y1Y018_9FUNG|nr:RNI-like protein [Basidiobolus meristosporus CBS 931.73]|eukprot:ORX91319.1 RNI-like protein [Basidiobolus meristosporus CBS 931.73]
MLCYADGLVRFLPNLRQIHLSSETDFSEQELLYSMTTSLQKVTRISRIAMSGCDKGVHFLGSIFNNCHKLEHLEIHVTDADLVRTSIPLELPDAASVKSLDIDGNLLDSEFVTTLLSHLPNLKRLRFKAKSPPRELVHILSKRCRDLREVEFEFEKVEPEQFACLENPSTQSIIRELHHLVLKPGGKSVKGIPSSWTLSLWRSFGELRNLTLRDICFTEALLKEITGYPVLNLRRLDMSFLYDTEGISLDIWKGFFNAIGRKLYSLSLSFTRFPFGTDLAIVESSPNLRYLKLIDVNTSDEAVMEIARCYGSQLKSLYIRSPLLTEKALRAVCLHLRSLENLVLARPSTKGSTMDPTSLFPYLRKSGSRLKELGLPGWRVSDSVINGLIMWSTELTHLEFDNNWYVSETVVKKLMQRCLNLVFLKINSSEDWGQLSNQFLEDIQLQYHHPK